VDLIVCCIAACVLLAAAAGCDDPQVRERLARREKSMDFAIGSYAKSEEKRPAQLQGTFDLFAEMEREHEEKFQRDLIGIEEWIQDDRDRWPENEPDILAELKRQFEGDPETARETLIMLPH
jgi:hypothetical protein